MGSVHPIEFPANQPRPNNELRVTREELTLIERAKELKALKSTVEREIEEINRHFKSRFASAGTRVGKHGRREVIVLSHHAPNRLDSKALVADNPDLAEQYVRPYPYEQVDYL